MAQNQDGGQYNAGRLTAGLSLDFRQFATGLRQVVQQVKAVGQQFKSTFNQATSSMNSASSAARQIQRDFKDLNNIVSGILMSQAFYNAVNAIENATSSLITFMNDMQKAQIAMEYFLGTPEKAQGFIANMKEFAATTAFSTQQALDLSRRLMGAQFDPSEIRSVMEILNDSAAATGATADQIDRIVLALTQVKTNGKVAGQELRQFAEAGIPIYQILREELGLTSEQLMNIGDLDIPADLGVTAILKGLQKRYEGAAQRIADTVPGMWATIKDDSLILGEAIFQAPYKALENFLRTWRDTWERAREALYESGLDGVVEEIFPPEIQQSIRVIVGSLSSIAESFIRLQKAMAPVIATLGKSFIQTLSAVMPVIASVVRVVATLASVALNAIPPLRWLMAALIGLLVARSAATSLMFLWKVMRLGVIAAAVAKAVNLLTAAIRALFLTLARNPMTAVILVISAALLHLALSSKTVTKWLDQLTARLSSLAGFKVDDVLQSENKDLNEWADEFNKEVSGIDDNLRDVAKGVIKVGDDAKKSGKKIKDKFVAAFDEVFQVPEDKGLDDLLDGLEDLEGIKVPDFNIDLPKLEELDLSGLDDDFNLEWPEFKWPEFVWPEFRWPEYPPWHWPPFALEFAWPPLPEFNWPPLPKWELPPFPKWEWPPIPVPVLEPIPLPEWEWPPIPIPEWEWQPIPLPEWEWQPIPIPAWDPIPLPEWEWPPLPQWEWPEWEWPMIDIPSPAFEPVLAPIRTWAADALAELANMMQSLELIWDVGWAAVSATISESLSSLGELFVTGWNTAIQALGSAMASFGEWFITGWSTVIDTVWTGVKDGLSAFGTWLGEHWQTILMGVIGALTAIAVGALAVVTMPLEAAAGAATLAATTIAAAISGALLLLAPFWDEIKEGLSGIWDAVVTWAEDVGSTLVEWTTGTIDTISQWVVDTSEAIASWVSDTWDSFTTWVSDVASAISDWAVDTAQGIVDWVSSTSAPLTGWVSETARAIANWVSETTNSFLTWSSGLISTFTTATQNALRIIGDWVSRGIRAVIDFVIDFGSEVGKIPGKLWDAIKGLPKTFADLIGELPGKIPSVVSAIAKEFGKLPGAIWEAIKSIPSKVGEALGNIKLPSFIVGENGVTAQFKKIGKIAGFAKGGIIDEESIVRVGERGKREAIIPLENPGAMQPFAEAVARHLQGSLTPQPGTHQLGGGQQILYVGTLIADDRSLRELERRMNVIRLNESARGVR